MTIQQQIRQTRRTGRRSDRVIRLHSSDARSVQAAPGISGFTLIELLVVIAIIALLIGILLPALAAAGDSARSVKSLAAARSLMTAHILYSGDNADRMIPGLVSSADLEGVVNEFGESMLADPFSAIAAARWPYRLGEYFDYGWGGTTHIGVRQDRLAERPQLLRASPFDFANNWYYDVSVYPSFGLNWQYVGLQESPETANFPSRGHELTFASRAVSPDRLITFASSRSQPAGLAETQGHHLIEPPRLGVPFEPGSSTGSVATRFGYVHPRYRGPGGGVAVAGFIDGHAATQSQDELTDRRSWSNTAARLNDPEWIPSPIIR